MKRRLPAASLVLLIGFCLFLTVLPRMVRAEEPAAEDLRAIWARVQQAGSYEFSADMTQTTQAPPASIKIGPSSQKTRMHMEGETDLTTGFLNMTLWNRGGSIALPETGLQIKIMDGVAEARRGAGRWQEIDDFSNTMAPGGDFLGILSAMDNVVRYAPETKETLLGEQTITRFTFDVNGRRYAEYIRSLLTKQMSSRGELPPGIQLEIPDVYEQMTGRGELWLGADGLPLRQQFELTFPKGQNGLGPNPSTVQAEINFTGFGSKPASENPSATAFMPSLTLPLPFNQALQHSGDVVAAIMATIVTMLLVVVVVFHSRSRRVYTLVVLTVSISMLASPILTSSTVEAYNQRQMEKKAASEARQAEADGAEAWQEALSNPNFDPHASPFDLAQTRQNTFQAVQAGSNRISASGIISTTSDSSAYFDSACETDPGSDNDGDGLTNLEECLIGTLPGAVDTDQDGVNDDLEVKGFVYDDNDGVTWYTNPLYPDTNRDGLGDGTEWYMDADNDGKPDDTDLDGIPDLWDDDNDGDGVPDDLDLSPYSTTQDTNVFDGNNPMQLIVDDLGEGLLTKVEIQLTPTNPDHLWYTNNVLDWADNDKQGQMQDADGLTFYDLDNTIDPFPNDLGDVRLVPMLEIEMTGTPNNLPDQSVLDQFGITTHETDSNTTTAYVPVSLVTDETGNRNVAFHGTMYYQAASSWGNAQTVRLVWLVQALVDVCETYENGICDTYSEYNDVQVIHSYDEEWYLTGMEVSEEQGTNMAIIYEDPAETGDAPLYVDTLYPFAYGLDRTFMAGADCEVTDENNNCVSGNGQFDLSVSGIYSRFNHSTNAGVPDVERWSLPNVLSVVTNTYPSVGLAMMDTAITQTASVLTDSFTSAWSATNLITPTLMFAWEHTYRVVGLSSDHLSWAGNILTVDVAASGTDPVQVQQTNGMKWAPYGYNPTDGWFAADFNSYWTELDTLLPNFFSGDDDVDGEVASAEFLYLGMYGGETNLIKTGDLLLSKNYESPDLPIQLEVTNLVGSGLKKGVAMYFGDVSDVRDAFRIIKIDSASTLSKLDLVGLKIRRYVQSYLSLLEESVGVIGIGLIMLTTYAALIVAGIYLFRKYVAHESISKGLFIATAVSLGTLGFIMGVIKPILSIAKTINGLIEVGSAATKVDAIYIMFVSGEGAPSVEYNILGLVISIGIAVAFFIALVASGQAKPNSIGAQVIAANTIAAIIEALIIFFLNLLPFTAILVGIAAIIDIILFALGINFSITGKLTEVIANAIYQFDLSVDTAVNTGSIATQLMDPAAGMVAGNEMIFSMPITTVITQSHKVDIGEDEFRSNSYVYDLAALDAYQSGLSTSHGDRAGDWAVVDSTVLGYIGTVSDTVSYEATLSAGINRSFVFYLDTAYDLLGKSCWWGSDCKDKYVDGTDSTEVGSAIVFDVYPSTVEEFVDVTAWSMGNLRIADADGDGLLPLGAGGVDPDDTNWDADGDHLSDQFELAMRALTVEEGGETLDATLRDTDGDGIPDNEELWLGTNPDNSDSDGDGLPDVAEAARADMDLVSLEGGWLFPYSISDYTRVWSDPNNVDYDGDGMTDQFELTQDTCPDCAPWADPDNPLLFSPYVYNENPVPIFLDDTTNDGFVTPGASFVYSTTTENNLSDGILLAGDVALALPDIFTGAPLSGEVALTSGYSETLVSEVSTAVSNSATGVLTSSMDLSALEDVVWSWDPVVTNSMKPVAGDIKALDAAAAPGFSDLYVYTALEINNAGRQYITAYAAGNDGNPTDSATLGYIDSSAGIDYTAPSVACNNSGVCLVVWGEPDTPNGGEINGYLLSGSVSQSSLQTIKEGASGISVSAPSVASDGVNFMVAWTEVTGSAATTWVRQVDANGSQSSITQVWEISNDGSNPIGLEWTGSAYFAVWINAYDNVMYHAEIDTSLNVGPVTALSGEKGGLVNSEGVISPLTLAYDTLSQQALVIHRGASQALGDYYLSATRFSIAGDSPVINLDTVYNYEANAAVCADPLNGGWILVWSSHLFSGTTDSQVIYQAVAPDGSLRDSEQVYNGSTDLPPLAIACRAPQPLVDLEFEENASSTIFADSSQYGNDATCTSPACPLGGVE
ncbi:MAG: hypothetical protein KC441_17595, partial [Anaerolineales bacterium]|nr:hypothetical protein [Anaerolineales bacterium]